MQTDIVAKAIAERGGKKALFLRYFNEQMGIYAITRQTLHKWGRGDCKPDPRILREALKVYPVNDPRYQFANELINLQKQNQPGKPADLVRE